ncbi:MAG: anti-sigma-K factor RskA [Oceanospirillaceae bacterium]
MSKTLRYQKLAIRQHLAQQYALNNLSDLTARRLEKLMSREPEFKNIVYRWQEKLTVIVDAIPEQQPPKAVWSALCAQHNLVSPNKQKSIWGSWFWPSSFAFALSALIIVSLQLYKLPVINTQFSPSYTAVMNKADNNFRFVINAYAGLTPGKSQLKIQWDQNVSSEDLTGLTLWSIARGTGKAEKIDNIEVLASQQYFFSKEHWLKIKNSEYLEVKRGSEIVYRGECIQLSSWKS